MQSTTNNFLKCADNEFCEKHFLTLSDDQIFIFLSRNSYFSLQNFNKLLDSYLMSGKSANFISNVILEYCNNQNTKKGLKGSKEDLQKLWAFISDNYNFLSGSDLFSYVLEGTPIKNFSNEMLDIDLTKTKSEILTSIFSKEEASYCLVRADVFFSVNPNYDVSLRNAAGSKNLYIDDHKFHQFLTKGPLDSIMAIISKYDIDTSGLDAVYVRYLSYYYNDNYEKIKKLKKNIIIKSDYEPGNDLLIYDFSYMNSLNKLNKSKPDYYIYQLVRLAVLELTIHVIDCMKENYTFYYPNHLKTYFKSLQKVIKKDDYWQSFLNVCKELGLRGHNITGMNHELVLYLLNELDDEIKETFFIPNYDPDYVFRKQYISDSVDLKLTSLYVKLEENGKNQNEAMKIMKWVLALTILLVAISYRDQCIKNKGV